MRAHGLQPVLAAPSRSQRPERLPYSEPLPPPWIPESAESSQGWAAARRAPLALAVTRPHQPLGNLWSHPFACP